MKAWLINLAYTVRYSLWFRPALLVLMALALAGVTIWADLTLGGEVRPLGGLLSASAQDARALLTTIASSVATVTGVVFSVTVVALSLASSQFGPRLIRNFMDDQGNQTVLGVMVATVVFCLLILGAMGPMSEQGGPQFSMAAALFLALLSLGVLVYFIHHIAASIQAGNLMCAVAEDMHESIGRIFRDPGQAGEESPREELPPGFDLRAATLPSPVSGYLRMVDHGRLVELAREHDILLRLPLRAGRFAHAGAPLALVWPPEAMDGAAADKLAACFTLGKERNQAQDVELAFDLLAEAALRALSPGINDPFTAMTCIDWMGSGLAQLAGREPPPTHHLDQDNALRLITHAVDFPRVCDQALRQVRQAAGPHPAVVIHLLEMLASVAPALRREADRQAVWRNARLIAQEGLAAGGQAWDRRAVENALARVKMAMPA